MSDNEDPGTRRSSRSRAKQSKNADVFEQIKQIRREGKVHRQNVDELVEDLYEEIDEDEYAEKYRADEFVVDDDGSGYVDNGQDDDEDPYYAANEKERKKKERRAGKVKKGALDNFFSAVIPSKKEAELVAPEKVDEDLNAMLAEVAESDILDDLAHEREPEEEFIPTPNKFKRNRPFSPDIAKFTPPSKVPRKHVKLTKRVQPTVVQKSSALPPPSSRFDDNNDCEFEFDSNDFDDAPSPPTTPQISKKEENILSKKFNRELSFEEEKPPETAQKTFETSKKNDISQIDFDESKLNFFEGEEESSPQTTVITDSDVSKTGYFQDTRSLRFYWFDAYEDAKNPGKVHLFGFIKKDGVFEFESCCVTIDKILHRVFFVKKDCNHETDEPVSDYMLYQEVNDLLINRYKVATFKSKSSIKRFAFMDGITPEEASCLEGHMMAKHLIELPMLL
uniref:DNA polymerase alpha catalytic subunit N-terminal domain-containing protein n=1 Tax=Panagrolaimus superbus TaxID=310955 RepID=A0A914Z5A4_9BILA